MRRTSRRGGRDGRSGPRPDISLLHYPAQRRAARSVAGRHRLHDDPAAAHRAGGRADRHQHGRRGDSADARRLHLLGGRVLRVSRRPAPQYAVPVGVVDLHHSPGPAAGRRRSHHRHVRQLRRRGQPGRRHGHFPDHHHRPVPGHHQGRRACRRSERALLSRRHARQADEHRWRHARRRHRHGRGTPPPGEGREGEPALRFHGRRHEVREGGCDRGTHHHRRQSRRRGSSSG